MAGHLPPPPLNGAAIKTRTFFAASLGLSEFLMQHLSILINIFGNSIIKAWNTAHFKISYTLKKIYHSYLKWLIVVKNWVTELVHDWIWEWLSEWMNVWVIEWISEWVIEWLSDWVIEWLSDWVIEWMSDWVIEWLSVWVIEFLRDWVI